jgi:hypothetical protein
LQNSSEVEIYCPANGSVKIFAFVLLGSYSPINCHWRLNFSEGTIGKRSERAIGRSESVCSRWLRV